PGGRESFSADAFDPFVCRDCTVASKPVACIYLYRAAVDGIPGIAHTADSNEAIELLGHQNGVGKLNKHKLLGFMHGTDITYLKYAVGRYFDLFLTGFLRTYGRAVPIQ